jgi:hypothetical protein
MAANPSGPRHVAAISGWTPGVHHRGAPITASLNSSPVETTQIAPTILSLLGLDPNGLQAVQIEHTATLPVG